jgi:hypothetical protein
MIARALLMFLRIYQAMFSPLMPVGCKFYPTCSHYAYGAVERFGARRGSWMALRRLLRCRPFTQGGFDPVPELDANSAAVQMDDHGGHLHREELAR